MATVKPVVRYIKNDGTAKVELRIGHNSLKGYINTGMYVAKGNVFTVNKLYLKSPIMKIR